MPSRFSLVLIALLACSRCSAQSTVPNPAPSAKTTPRFEAAACPKTPEPIEDLKTARCGFLIVPESRAIPSSRTIRLAVAIVRSRLTHPQPDPILFLAGGPGEAAILDIPFLVHAGINRNRDVVVIDQRGTLYDDPDLNCPELDRFYADQVSLVYDAPSTGRAQAKAAAACHRRLTGQGIDLAAYNTTENERDIVDLRSALHIHQWNVYGYSYGTDLTLSLLRDHPDGIKTAIIDSVVPPNIVSLPWTWSSFHEGITAVFRECYAQPSCASKYPDLLGTFTKIVIQLEAHPIVRQVVPSPGASPVKVILDGGAIVNMLVANKPKAANLPAALYNLANGNPQTFLETRAAGAGVADVPEQALGMTNSFICREWEPYGSPPEILSAGRREFPTLPDSVLINAPQLPFLRELCKFWNVSEGPASQRIRVRSTIPTLVVSGAIDAKTGAKWGRYQVSTLSNSTYVVIKGIGHWVIAQSPCAQRIFQSFLSHQRSVDTACASAESGVNVR
ncbi:MAG TPA: alpha/beta hydrolase [Candidatus Baltobacteraceae bacterium]|jgi:pimeloyl-ACP methyl ester carboxylesterase|nr:alpha/beta hydrolase [Candidatus Baltobacteraceae bacterium]